MIKGLELVHRGVVVITGLCSDSDEWCYGRVPNGTELGVFPRNHVRIIVCVVSVSIMRFLCPNIVHFRKRFIFLRRYHYMHVLTLDPLDFILLTHQPP